MSDKIIEITDETFEQEVLKADVPVLIDYWADWCGPCKMIGPILDELADEYDGQLKIVKLDIDDHPQTAPKYSVRSIPTMMIFKDGNVQATKVGGVSKSQLISFIEDNIDRSMAI